VLRKFQEGESESELEGGDDNGRAYNEEQSPLVAQKQRHVSLAKTLWIKGTRLRKWSRRSGQGCDLSSTVLNGSEWRASW